MNIGVYQLRTVDANLKTIGGKARNLAILIQNNFPVPEGFVVSLDAFENENLKAVAKDEIEKLIDKECLYAVRSSAMVEDGENASWAGQFESFLNVSFDEIIDKIVQCHNSKKERALSYANYENVFEIAVIVQKMINPDYAGVAFSKNPITGEDEIVTEYVDGLGEDLVSGKKDPIQIIINENKNISNIPFNLEVLCKYIKEIVKIYNGEPQDIEYAISNDDIYILQSRPITTKVSLAEDIIKLGLPDELFFWGPSKAEAKYMSDFFAGMELFFKKLNEDSKLPNPPVTLCLFNNHKMVWLNRTDEFSKFVKEIFKYYEKNCNIDEDIKKWNELKDKNDLVSAFYQTEMAEFALYGAETEILKRLNRFDEEIRRKIIAAFSTPDEETFLNRLDWELVELNDYKKMAQKNPWICDGYSGIKSIDEAEKYFLERLRLLNGKISPKIDFVKKRNELLKLYDISEKELNSLNLLKKLIKYMDDRKQWMMMSRKNIKTSFSKIEYGWYYNGKESKYLSKKVTEELYNRYVSFQSATGILKGIVASNGNHHFVSGEVVVVTDSTTQIDKDKILVCPMTSPSYIPLMRKAKALITDHGGAMSHAAIVAREFGLPAIVGTKRATNTLINGDKVMMDMLTGEIVK